MKPHGVYNIYIYIYIYPQRRVPYHGLSGRRCVQVYSPFTLRAFYRTHYVLQTWAMFRYYYKERGWNIFYSSNAPSSVRPGNINDNITCEGHIYIPYRLYDLQVQLINWFISFHRCQILSPSKPGFIVSAHRLTNITLLTLVQATL